MRELAEHLVNRAYDHGLLPLEQCPLLINFIQAELVHRYPTGKVEQTVELKEVTDKIPEQPFNQGDLVLLRVGGPLMIVGDVDWRTGQNGDSGWVVHCSYSGTDKNGAPTVWTAQVPAFSLIKVQ